MNFHEEPNTHSLHHGKEFHKKHQDVKHRKQKGEKTHRVEVEGFRGNQQDNAFYANTASVKEQSYQLLNKNPEIQNHVKNIQALEKRYVDLATQYNTVQKDLMTLTKNYANNTSTATNVYVTKVVNNPTATYKGVFIAGPNTMTLTNNTWDYNVCLQTALKSNNDYFSVGFNGCSTSNNLTTATNLGEAYSACQKGTDGNIYGAPGVNSVYQVPDATFVATFNDSPNRAMPFSNGGRQVDDYNSCRAQAIKGKYKFFGLQNGSMNGNAQCVVSNDYDKSTAQGKTSNSFVAKDGKTYGGGWANAIYEVNSSTPTYIGCFNEDNSKPAMEKVNFGAATYSVDSCLAEAQKAGSKYFAVQGMSYQDGNQVGKSQCSISNNLTTVKQYGKAEPTIKIPPSWGLGDYLFSRPGLNAIYKVDQTNGDPSLVGKLGYVDENGKLSAYPTGMNNKGTVTNGNPSCPKNVTAIDSIQWSNYPSSGTTMSPASVCGLAAAKEKDDRQLKSIESQMRAIANQIVQSTYTLQSYNSDLLKQMGVDKISLDDNLKKYKETNDDFSKYKTNYIKNTNGLLDDTQVMVNQESYSYMLWTMAAVTTVIVVLFTMK